MAKSLQYAFKLLNTVINHWYVVQSYNKGYRVVLNFETEIHQNSSFLYQIHSPKSDQIDAKSCLTKRSWQRRRIGATWPNAAPLPLPSLPPLDCTADTGQLTLPGEGDDDDEDADGEDEEEDEDEDDSDETAENGDDDDENFSPFRPQCTLQS